MKGYVVFTKYVDEIKNEYFFINMNVKIKLNFFSNIKLKFNLEPRT